MNAGICAVIGVGPGIGLAIAKRFGREGLRIAMLARSADKLEACRQELASAGVEAHAFPADAGSAESLAAAFAGLRGALGDPTVLVYNAAVMRPALPSALTVEELRRELDVNIVGALAAAKEVLPAMRAARRGTILFTGGGLALDPAPPVASLSIGKAGIRSLAISFAKELEPEGIHVATVTVCGIVKPGTPFDPELIADAYWKLHAQPSGSFEREIMIR